MMTRREKLEAAKAWILNGPDGAPKRFLLERLAAEEKASREQPIVPKPRPVPEQVRALYETPPVVPTNRDGSKGKKDTSPRRI